MLITCISVSPYSFYALSYLQKNKAALESLGVEIEYVIYHPDIYLTKYRQNPEFYANT